MVVGKNLPILTDGQGKEILTKKQTYVNNSNILSVLTLNVPYKVYDNCGYNNM